MRFFVTGGAGYVGSHCVRALVEAGHTVTVYDSLVYGHRAAVHPRASFIQGDLADSAKLREVLKAARYDGVLHFAAFLNVGESVREPLKYYRNNVAGTINLLDAMRSAEVRRLVFSSTCAVYGTPERLPIVEDLPKSPISPYGSSKLAVEWMLRDCAGAWGLGSIALRYFNAAGAAADGTLGEDHSPEVHLIPLVLQVALGQRDSIKVFGDDYPTPDGTCIRDYVHVEDLAAAHRAAIESVQPAVAEAFNVGTGVGTSVLELIEAARRITSHAIPAETVARRPGDPPALFADASRLRQRLSWAPAYRDAQSIVSTAWNWHRAHPHGFADRAR